jgi:predicted ArsR family transcriptional regulator
MATADDLPLLERRKMEAAVLVPVIRAMQAAFGEAKVNEVVGKAIRDIARAQGEKARERAKIETIPQLAAQMVDGPGPLSEGSLTVEVVQRDDTHFGFDVKRCQFMEMYEEMGARDLGFLLSCGRDFAMFEGMAPDVTFERTQTRMQGADFCDFRYRK